MKLKLEAWLEDYISKQGKETRGRSSKCALPYLRGEKKPSSHTHIGPYRESMPQVWVEGVAKARKELRETFFEPINKKARLKNASK